MQRRTLGRWAERAARRGELGFKPVLPGFEINKTTTVFGKTGDVEREFVQQKPEVPEVGFELPEGHTIKGVSALLDPSGRVKQQWVKTKEGDDLEALARETANALASEIEPLKEIGYEGDFETNAMTAMQIGDAHLGAYAWGPECNGGSFDLDIAQTDLRSSTRRLLASTPRTETCFINNAGDWFHTDTSKPFTPASGNLLDTGDSRWPKVVNSGVQCQRNIIVEALKKHHTVRVRNNKGNHDPHSAIVLDVAMKAYFDNNPRVIIEDDPRDMFWFTFGQNLMATTHGHNIKLENLPGVLAVDAREEWGRCEFRHIWVGHWHAKKMLDVMSTKVTVWPTLAANDKWHADKGYRSQKEMCSIVLHKDYGLIEEHTANLKLVRS